MGDETEIPTPPCHSTSLGASFPPIHSPSPTSSLIPYMSLREYLLGARGTACLSLVSGLVLPLTSCLVTTYTVSTSLTWDLGQMTGNTPLLAQQGRDWVCLTGSASPYHH